MNEGLYNSTITCPVCSIKQEVTKVKSKACKVLSRDTDFCVYYEGLNPILYDAWVCENCGYAAQADKFQSIPPRDARKVLDKIYPRWNKRSFTGERTIETAMEAFKLALYNLHLREAKSSEVAKVCIRIAWLYRLKNDVKELEFLKHAVRCYCDTYEKESFPVDKLDEFTCIYLIGELYRRTGNLEESIKWFSKIIGSPQARKNPRLMDNTRDQYMLAKEELAKSKIETA